MASTSNGNPQQTRRQRRAAAATPTNHSINNTNKRNNNIQNEEADFKLAQPDRSGPKGKSLLDIAAERQAQLTGTNVPTSSLAAEVVDFPSPNSNFSTTITTTDDSPAWATAVLYATTLSMVHFTLDVAVHNQYAQEIDWPSIARRLRLVAPAFTAIVYLLHARAAKAPRLASARQVLFFGFACVAGAFLVRATNTQAYMAVMSRVPPLGTLLIWSFVEMDLGFALAALGVVAGYVLWNGFSVI